MSLYILDTDVLTLLQQGHPKVAQQFLQHRQHVVGVSVITVEEQLTGWYTQLRKALKPDKLAWTYRRLAQNVMFLSRLPILDFTQSAIERVLSLQNLKINIGKFDLRIAATALEHGAVMVTRNARDFARVPGIVIEDWAS